MNELTAAELLAAFAKGASAEETTSAFLRRIHERDGRLNSFLLVDDESALSQARAVDGKRKRGEPLGALAGIPIAIKDILCVAGQKTTCGSKILRDFIPPYDAHVVARLKQADAILLGKTNMDEFAMGSS